MRNFIPIYLIGDRLMKLTKYSQLKSVDITGTFRATNPSTRLQLDIDDTTSIGKEDRGAIYHQPVLTEVMIHANTGDNTVNPSPSAPRK